uniref:Uncharacterized protein n=1 Tax=Panagrolaimus superbus TaxID=310955 RepID=A0A914YUC6_9BILA
MNPIKADDRQRQQLEHFIFVENCLIAEIHRLSQQTPQDFIDPNGSKFSKLLVDFSYFEDQKKLESFIEIDDELKLLEDKFYVEFNPFLRTFHKLVDEVCCFLYEIVEYSDKCQLNQNLLDRQFVQLNVLKCEVLFLLGIILLLLDSKFPGAVKERIFVAYFRSSIDLRSKHFELLVSLLRNRKEGFETCFPTVKVNVRFVEHVINFLKNYSLNQQHESITNEFSGEKQAAMIYVSLYFHPEILYNQQGIMRQIIDKYFQDRWIISLHIELTANLVEKWIEYPAAKNVFSTTLESGSIGRKATDFGNRLRTVSIPGGLLTVEQLGEYGKLIFEHNHILRWLILHSSESHCLRSPALPQMVSTASRLIFDELFSSFVKIAHFEHKFRQSCNYLIKHKLDESGRLKDRIGILFDQIIQLLGNDLFESQTWNERLKTWITTVKECVIGINAEKADTPQILDHLASKITEVAEMHDSEQKILKQYFSLVLIDIFRLKNICLIDAQFVGQLDEQRDATFAWDFLDFWSSAFDDLLKTNATGVKFVFLKLSSSVNNVLSGITVSHQEKAEILSEFYHRKLELHLRKIIQAIPRSIFAQMNTLQPLFSNHKSVHIEKLNLKQFADLERRHLLAKKTFEITKLSLGISSMCLNKLGPIEIRPKELLYDGLKEELRIKLCQLLAADLSLPNILRILSSQTHKIATFRDAFLFVCEHIGFNGVALWQNELEFVWNSAFKIEKTNLKSQKNGFQQKVVPSKNAPPKPILGQIIHNLVQQTNPRGSIYFCMKDEWLSVDLKKLEFSGSFFSIVEQWLPAIANVGLRRLIAFSIFSHTNSLLSELTTSRKIFTSLPELKWSSLSPLMESEDFLKLSTKILDFASKIGQLSIVESSLRRCIEESLHARVEDVLYASQNLITSLSKDIKDGTQIDAKPFETAFNFIAMIDRLGLGSSLAKSPTNVPIYSALALFGALINYLTTASNKKADFTDTFVVLTGIVATVKALRIHQHFQRLCCLLLSDANVYILLKNSPFSRSILSLQTIPEALRK